jgi:hypothetical protein
MIKMEQNKPWYLSKTVWGGLVAVGASALGFFGYSVDAGTQDQLSDALVMGATAIGGVLAIYGRVKATKKIK